MCTHGTELVNNHENKFPKKRMSTKLLRSMIHTQILCHTWKPMD